MKLLRHNRCPRRAEERVLLPPARAKKEGDVCLPACLSTCLPRQPRLSLVSLGGLPRRHRRERSVVGGQPPEERDRSGDPVLGDVVDRVRASLRHGGRART